MSLAVPQALKFEPGGIRTFMQGRIRRVLDHGKNRGFLFWGILAWDSRSERRWVRWRLLGSMFERLQASVCGARRAKLAKIVGSNFLSRSKIGILTIPVVSMREMDGISDDSLA